MSIYAVALLSASACAADGNVGERAEEARERFLAEELAVGAHWEQQGRTPRNTSYNPFESVLNANTIATLSTLWSVPLASNTLLLRNDVVYVQTNLQIRALSTDTGEALWPYDYGVLGGYTGGGIIALQPGCDPYRILRLNALHGGVTWDVSAVNTHCGDDSTSFKTQARLWRDWVYFADSSFGEPWGEGSESCSTSYGGSSGLVAWNVREALSWSRSVPLIATTPSVANDTLFISGPVQDTCSGEVVGGNTLALNAWTGETIWASPVGRDPRRRQLSGSLPGPAPTIINGHVYVADGAGTWVALDERTGDEVWRHTSATSALGPGELAATFDEIVISNEKPEQSRVLVEVIEPATGNLIRSMSVAGRNFTRPVIAGELVYVGVNSTLHVFELKTGALLRELPLSSLIKDVIVANGAVYVTTTQNAYRLGPS
ncbi:MAG: PQQ-binding-like beta-propeller repeat protein [Myxococcota bacterium]